MIASALVSPLTQHNVAQVCRDRVNCASEVLTALNDVRDEQHELIVACLLRVKTTTQIRIDGRRLEEAATARQNSRQLQRQLHPFLQAKRLVVVVFLRMRSTTRWPKIASAAAATYVQSLGRRLIGANRRSNIFRLGARVHEERLKRQPHERQRIIVLGRSAAAAVRVAFGKARRVYCCYVAIA